MSTTEPRQLAMGWQVNELWTCTHETHENKEGPETRTQYGNGRNGKGACGLHAAEMGVFELVEQKPVRDVHAYAGAHPSTCMCGCQKPAEPACNAPTWCGLHWSDERVPFRWNGSNRHLSDKIASCSNACTARAKNFPPVKESETPVAPIPVDNERGVSSQVPAKCVNNCTNGAWCGLCRKSAQPPVTTWKAPRPDVMQTVKSYYVVPAGEDAYSLVAALPSLPLDSSRTMASRESRWKTPRYETPGRWRKA